MVSPMTIQEIAPSISEFFKKKGHVVIPSASLVPEGDATTLLPPLACNP